MQRRILLSKLAKLIFALAVMAFSFATTSTTASAQLMACSPTPIYTVDLSLVPAACSPFVVKTSWGGGAVSWPPTGPYATPGIYPETPPTPVSMLLDFVDVFGTSLPPFPGQYDVRNTPCGPVCVTICKDSPFGCLYIKIYPGACPAVPLPCP